jgi:hypothetical protein
MTDEARKIKEKLDVTYVSNEALNQLIKDRLDFGFDSIYFRYSEVCDELAAYKSMYDRDKDPVRTYKDMFHRKMHFYEALEQLLHAHEEERNKYGINK